MCDTGQLRMKWWIANGEWDERHDGSGGGGGGDGDGG